ncbi:hypothetical protein AXF13_00670 [Desulfovibrio fairfieldensis]|uniref:Uncharacterized protein n=1 Tax=Desulfovibrio fairfieldensis TaxID=44742 RepID=A0A0X8JHH7_9BACT|nr:hypothetical protein AXF13_00670 [Desulfovibrio fairfieldensis]
MRGFAGMFRDAEQLFYKKALTDEGRMDIFHFPRLNNTFLGLSRHGEKKLCRNEKKLLTQPRGWCINLHRAAEKSGRGRRPSGGSLTSE